MATVGNGWQIATYNRAVEEVFMDFDGCFAENNSQNLNNQQWATSRCLESTADVKIGRAVEELMDLE